MSDSLQTPTAPPRLGIFGSLRQVVLILLGMILFSSTALIAVRLYNKPQAAADSVVQARLERLAAKRAEEAKIHTYHWVDQKAGVVALPVERAMELTASELKNKPVRRSEVAPPPPAPTP